MAGIWPSIAEQIPGTYGGWRQHGCICCVSTAAAAVPRAKSPQTLAKTQVPQFLHGPCRSQKRNQQQDIVLQSGNRYKQIAKYLQQGRRIGKKVQRLRRQSLIAHCACNRDCEKRGMEALQHLHENWGLTGEAIAFVQKMQRFAVVFPL